MARHRPLRSIRVSLTAHPIAASRCSRRHCWAYAAHQQAILDATMAPIEVTSALHAITVNVVNRPLTPAKKGTRGTSVPIRRRRTQFVRNRPTRHPGMGCRDHRSRHRTFEIITLSEVWIVLHECLLRFQECRWMTTPRHFPVPEVMPCSILGYTKMVMYATD